MLCVFVCDCEFGDSMVNTHDDISIEQRGYPYNQGYTAPHPSQENQSYADAALCDFF